MRPDDEGALVARARAGDRAAAERLVEAHWRPVYRYLFARLGNRLEAEDLTQETFARFWSGLPRLTGEVAPYLFAVARNVLRNHFRARRRHDPATLATHAVLAPSAEEEALLALTEAELLEALATLTADQQAVLRLRLVEGWSVAEVARRLGRRPEAVRALQHRALVRLRHRLVAGPARRSAAAASGEGGIPWTETGSTPPSRA